MSLMTALIATPNAMNEMRIEMIKTEHTLISYPTVNTPKIDSSPKEVLASPSQPHGNNGDNNTKLILQQTQLVLLHDKRLNGKLSIDHNKTK
mmetsp:Transcript_64962/g.76884  ORF Transcript_64962/g.76884 Transcript_64962/m.76884 type:complete len:92 (+) Transcript_64962:377-652(+)